MPVRVGTGQHFSVTRSQVALRRGLPLDRVAAGRGWSGRAVAATLVRERVAVLAVLLVGFLVRIPTLGIPLDEFAHPFRQTQTAYVALLFHQQGIDLFHAQLPVLGPPWEIPLEFPLFQALASLVMDVGVAPDLALRLTALACFFVTAALLWALVRRIASPVAAFAALVLFVFSPFALVWSRAELIEYLATAAALGWLLVGMRWRDRGGAAWWVLAVSLGCVALLVKVTTGVFWILPLLAYRPVGGETWRSLISTPRRALAWAAVLFVPFAVAYAWTAYADSIKAATPLTAWLTSSQLVEWNFGTIAQRLDPNTWFTILARAGTEFGGPLAALFVVGVLAIARAKRQRLLWVAVLGTATLPILVFFNLYWIHDYYLIAVSPGIAMVQGLLVAYLLEPLRKPAVRRAVAVAMAVFFAFSLLATQPFFWGFVYANPGDPDATLAEAAELAANSSPGDLALTDGRDWSPAVLYFAGRRGLAVPDWMDDGSRTDLIDPSLYRVASFFDPATGHLELLSRWPLVGVTGQRTYAMGTAVAELRSAPLVAADAGALPMPADAVALTSTPIELTCSPAGATSIPIGASGTWLELAPAPATARLTIGSGYGAVPARSIVQIAAGFGGSTSAQVSCSGASELRIQRVLGRPQG